MASDRLEKLRRLLELEPDDAFCLYALAQEHAKAADHEQAIACFDRVIVVEPAHGYAYYHKARSLEAMGRTDDARATLRSGLRAVSPAADAKAHRELQEYLQSLGG
ncbi:MAG: tetratricopeptide repeat protein [Phycisphaerales bacterium]|nr:tetratricopeptide repeat protein [Phycisphaerales bacterium]